jgi:hypothetical protein
MKAYEVRINFRYISYWNVIESIDSDYIINSLKEIYPDLISIEIEDGEYSDEYWY